MRIPFDRFAAWRANTRPAETVLAAALAYARSGMPVLPLHGWSPTHGCTCGDEMCLEPGRHPQPDVAHSDATTASEEIERWWACWPHANVATLGGRHSGLVAIREYVRWNGPGLAELCGERPTLSLAPQGDYQWHLQPYAPDHCRTGALSGGFECYGDGSLIVLPPSVTLEGRFSWSR